MDIINISFDGRLLLVIRDFATKLIFSNFALQALREWLSGVTSLIAAFGAFTIISKVYYYVTNSMSRMQKAS